MVSLFRVGWCARREASTSHFGLAVSAAGAGVLTVASRTPNLQVVDLNWVPLPCTTGDRSAVVAVMAMGVGVTVLLCISSWQAHGRMCFLRLLGSFITQLEKTAAPQQSNSSAWGAGRLEGATVDLRQRGNTQSIHKDPTYTIKPKTGHLQKQRILKQVNTTEVRGNAKPLV